MKLIFYSDLDCPVSMACRCAVYLPMRTFVSGSCLAIRFRDLVIDRFDLSRSAECKSAASSLLIRAIIELLPLLGKLSSFTELTIACRLASVSGNAKNG